MGVQNPMLMNQVRRPGQAPPPSGLTPSNGQGIPGVGDQTDYFRTPPYEVNGDRDLRQEPQDSINPARVWQSVRMRWNPIRGLTFERLVKYLDEFNYGYFRQCGMLWQQMMKRDYQLRIDAPKRFKSVARHGFEIMTVDKIPDGMEDEAEEQREFLEDFYNNITACEAMNMDRKGGMSLLLRQMMESVAFYYAVHEIIWEPKDDGTLGAQFIYCPIWWFEGTRGKLRYLKSEFQVWGEEMEPAEWLVTVGDGLMEACAIVYMLKHGAVKSWVSFLEKFGMPGIVGKTHAKKGSVEWNSMIDAVTQFSNEWATVIGGCSGDLKENDISLIEARAGENSNAFSALIEKLDRAVTQMWRGGDLTTSSGKNQTGASLQGDESEILETDDAKVLEETLAEQVSKYALQWKFGSDVKVLAYLKLRTTPQEDFTTDIAVDNFLVSNGVKLSATERAEAYGRQVATEEDIQKNNILISPQTQQQNAQADLQQQQMDAQQQQQGDDGSDDSGDGESDDSQSDDDSDGPYFPQNAQFAQEKQFDANAIKVFTDAYKMDMTPLVERLKAIYQIQDPVVLKTRLQSFRKEIQRIRQDLQKDNEASQALTKIISAALANGLATDPTSAPRAEGGKRKTKETNEKQKLESAVRQ